MEIRFLKHEEIDKHKWDLCIKSSDAPMIYAESWYLDRVVKSWQALVAGDYEAVLPLPLNKKLIFSRVMQPIYCQQLGLFASKNFSGDKNAFFENIPYRHVNINVHNEIRLSNHWKTYTRHNYELDLSLNYKDLKNKYHLNTKRNLKKAETNNLELKHYISIDDFLKFKQSNRAYRFTRAQKKNLKELLNAILYKELGRFYLVYKEDELVSAGFFVFRNNRAILLQSVSSEEGIRANAMAFLIDSFIKEHAEQHLVLDFEGSMIPGVARFYESFGGQKHRYFQLIKNNVLNKIYE